MGFFDIFSSSPTNLKDKLQMEKEVHDEKIERLKRDIDGAKKQIESLKSETERLRKANMLDTSRRKYFKRRIDDWKNTIKRRRDDIAREQEYWKRRREYLKTLK